MDNELHLASCSLEGDKNLKDFIRITRQQEAADAFYASGITRVICLGVALLNWRRNTLWVCRLRTFVKKIDDRRRHYLNTAFFAGLSQAASRSRRQSEAIGYLRQRRLSNLILAWRKVYRLSIAVDALQVRSLRDRGIVFLHNLRRRVRQRKKAIKKVASNDALVLCFKVMRIFNAWKGLYQRSSLRLSCLSDVALLCKASSHFILTLFAAWRKISLAEKKRKSELEVTITSTIQRKMKRWCLKEWSKLYAASRLCRISSGRRAFSALRTAVLRSGDAQENVKRAVSLWRTKCVFWGFSCLSVHSIARGRLKAASSRVRAVQASKLCRRTWLRWYYALKKKEKAMQRAGDALLLRMRNLLRRTFQAWAVFTTLSKRKVSSISGKSVSSTSSPALFSRSLSRTSPSTQHSHIRPAYHDGLHVEEDSLVCRKKLLLLRYFRR